MTEKADQVAVVPVGMDWNKVGCWDPLHAISDIDDCGSPHRRLRWRVDPSHFTKKCYMASDGIHIALVGVDDLIVVASGNDVLIMPRGRSQEIKTLIGNEALGKMI